jgi:transcription elongation factor GreA
VIEDIRRAAKDKDFRENAPLHAAREQKGKIDGRMMEIEASLKAAVIIDEPSKDVFCVSMGNTVVIIKVGSPDEARYTLVGINEVDPTKGRISNVSPIGRAIMGRTQGETVEIIVPMGRVKYQIVRIEK